MALDPNTARLLDVYMNTINTRLGKMETAISAQLSKLETQPTQPAQVEQPAQKVDSEVAKDLVQHGDRLDKVEARVKNIEIVIGRIHKTLESLASKKEAV